MPKPLSPQKLNLQLECLESRAMLTGLSTDAPGLGHPAVLSSVTSQLTDIHRITGVEVAHHAGYTGAGQTVVVIDSGVAYDHPALGGGLGASHQVVGGWDFTEENDADPYDDGPAGYHGTHVAGILGSNDPQHLGVTPDADIVALRIFNDVGRGKLSWLESSLQWVIENQETFEHPITTVNMSIGTTWNDVTLPDYAKLEDELQSLRDMGIFVVGAAGNRFESFSASNSQDSGIGLSYPAVSPHVIAAASSDNQGQLSDFSQRHSSMLVVPGEKITSTVPDYLEDFNGRTDDFHAATGTSMAAPYLAGVSMLVRQAMQQTSDSPITVDAIYDVLATTADQVLDPATNQLYHRVNVENAIRAVAGTLPVSVQGDQLIVHGTEANDTIQFDQRGFVRINGVQYPFAQQEIERVTISGNGGEDHLTIDVRQANSHAAIRPLHVELQGTESWLQASDFERIDVLSRTEGLTAEFESGENRDRLFVHPTHSWMESGSSTNYVYGAKSVVASANNASDTVTIYDGTGDDTAIVTPDSAQVTAGDFSAELDGYTSYTLRATNGGNDTVTLVGSSGKDEVRSRPDYLTLRTGKHEVHVRGYEDVTVQGQGGNDNARIQDGPDNDQLTLSAHLTSLVTANSTTELQDFTHVDAVSKRGVDTVTFVGSKQDEVFVAKPDHSFATFATAMHSARGFYVTVIDAAAGQDSVWLYDSPGNDTFQLGRDAASASGQGFQYSVRQSEYVHAVSRSGNDRVSLIENAARDQLFSDENSTMLRGVNFIGIAEGFWQTERLRAPSSLATALAELEEASLDLSVLTDDLLTD